MSETLLGNHTPETPGMLPPGTDCRRCMARGNAWVPKSPGPGYAGIYNPDIPDDLLSHAANVWVGWRAMAWIISKPLFCSSPPTCRSSVHPFV